MDFRIVHPVPLAVHDVVADLHVLEDLRDAEACGAGQPRRLAGGAEQQHAAGNQQLTLGCDHRGDVLAVLVTEAGVHLVVNGVELLGEFGDRLVTQVRQRVHRLIGVGDAPGGFVDRHTFPCSNGRSEFDFDVALSSVDTDPNRLPRRFGDIPVT